jgi:acyl-CoA synthetase (NDP forming)
LIRDCASKGVGAVSFFTAGFSEAENSEGHQLEQEMLDAARAGGVRILGPNCVGVYNPKAGLSFGSDFPRESGRAALICQSGGNAIYTVRAAAQRGVRLSKAVSYGNALDIGETELLEYLCEDPETDVIAAYVEGVKDGGRFQETLRNVCSVKPVIILKCGNTGAGARAAASHTGSMAGSDEVWDGLLEQVGAVRVDDLDELADMLVAFTYLRVPVGRRLGVFGAGGGFSVMTSDACSAAGFVVPAIPDSLQQDIRKDIAGFLNTDAGFMLNNPLDVTNLYDREGQSMLLRRLADYEGLDLLVTHFSVNNSGWPYQASGYSGWTDFFTDAVIRVHRETDKPMAIVIHAVLTSWDLQRALELRQKCWEAGVPVFRTIPSAARAMGRFMRYHERRHSQPSPG